MAKKYDNFRPDRTGRSFFDRLYITPLQRQKLLKWILYAATVLLMSVLQDVVLCRINLLGSTTDLVPCAIMMICVVQGVEDGCVFAIIASFLYVFSGSSAGYHVPFLITSLSIAVSIFRQSYLRKGFSATMLCVAVAMAVYETVIFVICLFLQQTYFARVGVFALRLVWTLAAMPLLWPIVSGISKIGGDAWKE